jgi:hypothetical protein
MGFPRIANIYGYGSAQSATAYSRYGLVVSAGPFIGPAGALARLKAQSPQTKVLAYYDTVEADVPGFDGLSIYPGWWLTLAGTTLSASLDASSTTVHVANASVIANRIGSNPDVLVDGESMHVLSVNTGANTLTVQRGYNSTATTHAAGARLAAHATNWPGSWMLNMTSYCPTNPATGQTWVQYLAHQVATTLASGPWDGVFYDVTNTSMTGADGGQIDANNDNVADGGNGPSGTGWSDGQAYLSTLTRSLIGNALITGNGGWYTGQSGREFENFPNWVADGTWLGGLNYYLSIAGPTSSNPPTIVNPYASDSTGLGNLQGMRFNLGIALLGNGYFAYDSTSSHGQTWWYDEYDDGAGSSLASTMSGSQTSLTLAGGTGSKFKVGNVVQVPDDVSAHDDEQMLVTSVNGDTLGVQRGYNGSQVTGHPAGTKVFTAAQEAAGLGWLGQPVGPAVTLASNLWRRDFTGGTVLLNGSGSPQTVTVGPGYRRIAGTQSPTVNSGATVSTVTVAPQDALLLVKNG